MFQTTNQLWMIMMDVYDGGDPLIHVSKPCLILFITEVANK